MSHTDKSRPRSAYRAPTAAVVGKVEDLTAGAAYNYKDGTGNYQQDKQAPARTREVRMGEEAGE
ncbi:MAG TPA: hypothetical protein VFX98_14360 [Longimicrobiaceae bacterium]|nr:hypothetical protein [Longimicrobiaceae bacterium]